MTAHIPGASSVWGKVKGNYKVFNPHVIKTVHSGNLQGIYGEKNNISIAY